MALPTVPADPSMIGDRVNGAATPRISIGVPVFNGEVHLPAALDALLAQSFGDFEIVISDNHSTDRTESICLEYASRDPRIRYHRADRNRGAAWNFNRVVELARAPYFKWASSNDLHAPTHLARCIEVLDAEPGVVLAYAKARIIDGTGTVMGDAQDNLHLPWADPARRFREYLRRVRLCNPIFGVLRRDVILRTGMLRNYVGSDIVLLGELSLHGRFHEVPESLFYRRLDEANFARDQSLEKWQEFFDPKTKGKLFMRTWRHQFEYLMAARRAPISICAKARVASLLCRGYVTYRHLLARELADVVTQTAQRGFRRRPVSRT